MNLLSAGFLVLLTAVGVKILPHVFISRLPMFYNGKVAPQFAAVESSFRDNFKNGWEHEGAAFAVYYKGKLVVDLWGGYADESSMRPWQEDTMSTAVSSLCIAVLVDRRLLSYDDLVTKHWPEFGKNGKENITISMFMNHQAGLAALDVDISEEDAKDHNRMSVIFEEQTSNWPIGIQRGYHAWTFGWLVDQLIRRIDKKHRSLGQFFNEEIAKPNNIDFYIGLPPELEYKVARLSPEGFSGTLGQIIDDPSFLYFCFIVIKNALNPNNLLDRLMANAKWLDPRVNNAFNNPFLHQLEIPSANGIGSARGLAKTFSLLTDGSLLSEKMIKLFEKPITVNDVDAVLQFRVSSGYGFFYYPWPATYNQSNWLVGHPGFGGSSVKFDIKNQLAFAYVTNGIKPGMGDIVRTYSKLQRSLYNCL